MIVVMRSWQENDSRQHYKARTRTMPDARSFGRMDADVRALEACLLEDAIQPPTRSEMQRWMTVVQVS
jgi:hypothetical protein